MVSNLVLVLFTFRFMFCENEKNLERDEMTSNLVAALNDNENLQNWLRETSRHNLNCISLLRDIVVEVTNIVAVINTQPYATMQRLIMNTNICSPKDINFPNYLTYIIVRSIQRIVRMNNINESMRTKSLYDTLVNSYQAPTCLIMLVYHHLKTFRTGHESTLYKKISFMEYEHMLKDIENVLCTAKTNYIPDDFLRRHMLRLTDDYNLHPKTYSFQFIHYSRVLFSGILPQNKLSIVFVRASPTGVLNSNRCDIDFRAKDLKKKYTMICSDQIVRVTDQLYMNRSRRQQINLEEYMNSTYTCNKSASELLISLIHLHTFTTFKKTIYKVTLQEDNEYKISWSYNHNLKIEEIKEFYLRKEIQGVSSYKKIHKFGLIIDYDTEYSTIKSEDTKRDLIKTRLILLSCGHQLGLRLIDEFFDFIYKGLDKDIECHLCRQPISIIGSYDTVVYRCK